MDDQPTAQAAELIRLAQAAPELEGTSFTPAETLLLKSAADGKMANTKVTIPRKPAIGPRSGKSAPSLLPGCAPTSKPGSTLIGLVSKRALPTLPAHLILNSPLFRSS